MYSKIGANQPGYYKLSIDMQGDSGHFCSMPGRVMKRWHRFVSGGESLKIKVLMFILR